MSTSPRPAFAPGVNVEALVAHITDDLSTSRPCHVLAGPHSVTAAGPCPKCGGDLNRPTVPVSAAAAAVLFSVTFTADDLDWIADQAGVPLAVATQRAFAAARAIRDSLIESGNALLCEAVEGTL